VRASVLSALATLALAAALPAQVDMERAKVQEDGGVAVSVKVAQPVGRAYRHALDAMVEAGYPPRMLLLNEALITQPAFAAKGKPDAAVMVHFTPAGDSTTVKVEARPFWPDPSRPCRDTPCAMAALQASAEVADAVTRALASLPPEPRTQADSLREAKAYGYVPENPVRVGGGRESGVASQYAFLRSLRGPGGEAVSYFRLGSCCPFTAPGETEALARIDAYEVSYPGLAKPVLLYFDIYHDADRAGPPHGFTRAPAAAGPST
jgi:hypothetical protein